METISYESAVKANKEHRCNFCCEKINKGESYFTSTHKQDATIYNWKAHKHCSDIATRLRMYEDCDEGLTTDSFQETIHYKYFDLLVTKFSKEDEVKYTDVIEQLRYVKFKDKLSYVIRHYTTKTETPHERQNVDYEYEMFFKSEPNESCKIDGWYPIATDTIKKPENIDSYIKSGLLRRLIRTKVNKP